jgi:hypothetical protein
MTVLNDLHLPKREGFCDGLDSEKVARQFCDVSSIGAIRMPLKGAVNLGIWDVGA